MNNNPGRLEYWRVKKELSLRAYLKQLENGDKQGEAVANLERFIHARNKESELLAGEGFEWLNPTGGAA
jgi:hypothetical protein